MSRAEEKKKVLLFTLSPPLPATTGESIYAVNAVLPLANEVEYHLYCIGGEREKAQVEKHAALYAKYFHSVHVEPRARMPLEKSFWGRVAHVLVHMLYGLPFMDASYFSFSAVRQARRIVRDKNIDLLEINSSHLAFFKRFLRKPAFLVSHNIESDLFPFWIPAGLSRWKYKLVEAIARISRRNAHRVEIANCWNFYAETFISMEDMARVTSDMEKHYLPLCMPVVEVAYMEKAKDACHYLWLGGFGWYPNADGVLWFVNDIYPHIQDKLEAHRIVLHFVGSHPPAELLTIADGKHVVVHGFVESLDSIFAMAHVLFVPLRIGGGVRVKVLEALSRGIPVLSTSKGCEGLGAVNDRDVVVRDDPQGFAEAMQTLAASPGKRADLSCAGQNLLRSAFDLERCLDIKRRLYRFPDHQQHPIN